MTPTYTQVGGLRFGYRSCLFTVDNFPVVGVVGVAVEQKRVRKTVGSRTPGARPLGRTTGLYSVPVLKIKMLREDSEVLAQYIGQKTTSLAQFGAYGDQTFKFSAQCLEDTNPDATVTMLAEQCVITGRNSDYDKAVGALIEEFTIEALQVAESDKAGQRFLYSTAPNALDALAQDFVVIGGDVSPGRATILDPKREIGWDIRQAYGMNLATLVPKGNPPATFSIRFDLWDEADLPKWNAFSAKWLKYATARVPGATDKNGNPVNYAISVKHPILQAQPIALQQCVIAKIGGLNVDEEGLWGCTVDFLEYGLPVIARQAPTAAVPAAAQAQPTATSAAEVKIQALRDRAAHLADDRANQIGRGAA